MTAVIALLALTSPTGPAEAVRYANEQGGLACLVMIDGKVVAEEYANGGRATRASELASGTKSFSGIMAQCAAEDGLLRLDELASETLNEWKTDPRKSKITIRQILTLTSGLAGGSNPLVGGRVPSYKDAIAMPVSVEPGSRFQYSPAPFQAFGEILRRKLASRNETVVDYMERRLWKPLGIKPAFWRRDEDGNPHLPSGAHLTARDWAKFGEMVRLGGQGVLPKSRLDECFVGTKARPGYGLTWWLPGKGDIGANVRLARDHTNTVPPDTFMAAGAGGQLLIVIPSRKLTAVRLAPVRMGTGTFRDREFLRLLVRVPGATP